MHHFKKFVSLVILLSSLLVSMASAAETLDRIVAVVNTHVITQQQLNEQIELARQQAQAENKPIPTAASFRTEVLNHMIDTELQRQLAETAGMKVDEAGLDKTIASIAQRNGLTVGELRSRLEQENIPYAKYRQKIREQLITARLQQDEVGQKITVTPQEITDALAHMPKPNSGNAAYHIEDLLVPLPNNPSSNVLATTKQAALSLLQQAKSGRSFQQLVEQPQNASLSLSGGDLGWRPLNELPDIFQSSVQSLKPGEIAGPIQAQNGFHLIRLLESRGSSATAPRTVTSTHVRHILIKTSPLVSNKQAEQRLREIRAEILRGGNFADLAKKYSQDPGSAVKGGDLGWTLPGTFDPTFETQENKLPLNQLSLPFQTQFGWHLIQVLGREQKLQTTESLTREQAAQWVYQKKFQQALQNWLRQLRRQSYVKIM
ncbi:chaperone SurA [Candidatus Rickettsiella viridis]|uniref:Chaperone SurA n=1 Tax=Candidatus Rickettsiella viridis TaxID=676208 RepID=A0A2Z5UVZ2_9COXI|nr:peptidylprolyl isomerase [Candidatus Rickettsiella viridis]BBB15786.1 chaperone SurA [Candidatus Rickettsiella viridis]